VAEAEGVLLEAAGHVAAGVRALWQRRSDPGDAASIAAAAGRRRLDCWLAACAGQGFALTEVDAPPRPGWLARMWGQLAPWERRPVAVASSDGRSLFLPRGTLIRVGTSAAASDLLLVLGLAARSEWARDGFASNAPPLERDVCWLIEGALVDAAMACMLPGLAREIEAARSEASAARPARDALRPAERAVEELMLSLLQVSLAATPARIDRLVAGSATPESIGAFAARFASSLDASARSAYRGMAPVAHWGIPDVVAGEAVAIGNAGRAGPAARVPGRRLRRRIARRRSEPSEPPPQAGPFLLPSSDSQLSVQDPRGLDRPPDQGDEELDPLADELSRIRELPTLGEERGVREILEDAASARSVTVAATSRDSRVPNFVYPEWDFRVQGYRREGCRLRECDIRSVDAAAAAGMDRDRIALLRRVRRQFEALRPRRKRLTRRLDGDGIDLDGWTLELAEQRARGTAGGRLYTEDRPARRDVSVALLLDASGSTDAWVSKHQRVIDVAKEAALCFCEALTALGDRFAVYAFSGQGAGDVRVWVPKRFEDPYGARVRGRIATLQPDRFTRLGGAIRHVTANLAHSASRLRLLLLLSDGKPNDEDAYEGEYGIEDVRQALIEARALGVRPFCLTIDREGSGYLSRIFGSSGYAVLWDVAQLPLRLPAVYRQLTAGADRG